LAAAALDSRASARKNRRAAPGKNAILCGKVLTPTTIHLRRGMILVRSEDRLRRPQPVPEGYETLLDGAVGDAGDGGPPSTSSPAGSATSTTW
jgi:hypothetical protein